MGVTGKTTIGLEGYLETFLAKAAEHGFTPDPVRNIVRYLLTNGHINITDQHLILMGNEGFHLGADRIPKDYRRRHDLESMNIHEKLLKAAKEVDQRHWSPGDFNIVEHVKDVSTELEGVWIKNGKVNSVTIGVTRVVEVYEEYSVPVDLPLFDEIELDCPDCGGILEVLETPHPKGWTHLCKGDCGGYHAPYGKDYSNSLMAQVES